MDAAVIDCSLVAAFLLREPEGKRFDPLLLEASKDRIRLLGPALLPFELLNVVVIARRRKRIGDSVADEVLSEFDQLPIDFDAAPESVCRMRIRRLAETYGLTAYDAAYLELSERVSAPLYTLDNDLLKLKRRIPRIR